MNYLQRLPSLGGNELCERCSDKASIIRLSHKHPLCNSVIKTQSKSAVERIHTNAQRGESDCGGGNCQQDSLSQVVYLM